LHSTALSYSNVRFNTFTSSQKERTPEREGKDELTEEGKEMVP
jgi:hypothetical protein